MEHVSDSMTQALDKNLATRLLRIEEGIREAHTGLQEVRWMIEVLRKLYNAKIAPPSGGK